MLGSGMASATMVSQTRLRRVGESDELFFNGCTHIAARTALSRSKGSNAAESGLLIALVIIVGSLPKVIQNPAPPLGPPFASS